MHTSLIALVFLVQHLASSSTISLSQQVSQNATLSVTPSPFNTSSLHAPVPPPDFETEIAITKGYALNPKGFFVTIAHMLATIGLHIPWDSYLNDEGILDKFEVKVAINPLGEDWLKASYAALGLNQVAIAAVQEPLLYRSFTRIKMHGLPIGTIAILRSEGRLGDNQTIEDAAGSNLTTSDFPNSGTFIEAADPRVKLAYDFDGRKISSKDMFTAVTDGLTTIAQHHPAARCEYLTAVGPVSSTGQAVIHIQEFSNPPHFMAYYSVTNALLTIFEKLMINHNKWGEMTFETFWDKRKVGSGYVLKLEPVHGAEGAVV